MADAVTICNLALSYVGDSASVVSIDPPEGSSQGKLCALFYPLAKAALLEKHDWSFAKRSVRLSRYAEESPDTGWSGSFSVPANSLRIVRVWDAVEALQGSPASEMRGAFLVLESVNSERFDIVGDKLFTNARYPVAEFIASDVKESEFSPMFATALAHDLAVKVAGARVKGQEGYKLSQVLRDSADRALREAVAADARNRKSGIDFVPTWIRKR